MHCKRLAAFLFFQSALAVYAGNGIADDEVLLPEEPAILISSVATYRNHGRISENAKAECGLERSVPKAIEKFAPKFHLKAALYESGTPELSNAKSVSLEIEDLVAGAAGNGFGGRWVVSELGITVFVKKGTQELANKYFSCTAGLGAIPINFRACDRLDKCSEKLGAQIAKWLTRTPPQNDRQLSAATLPSKTFTSTEQPGHE